MHGLWTRVPGRLRTWAAGAGFALLAVAVAVTWFRPGSAGLGEVSISRRLPYLDDTPLVHLNAGAPGACWKRLSTYAVTGALLRSKTIERFMASHGWLRLTEKLRGLDAICRGAIGRWLKGSLLAGELTLSVFDGEEPEGLVTVRTSDPAGLGRLLEQSPILFASPAGSQRVWITKHVDPPLCVMVLAHHWAASTSKELLVRFSHSYVRAGHDPCRALGMPAIGRTPEGVDVSLDTVRLAKARWFRRYYMAALDPAHTARWQRWRVAFGPERVTIGQDIEWSGARATVRMAADPFASLAPAGAATYEFECETHPDPNVAARVKGWLVEALGAEWKDVALKDAACWSVPLTPTKQAAPGLVSVVAARFRDRAGARTRLAKSRTAWAAATGGTFSRADGATRWCISYRARPRLIHRWYEDVLVVGSGATHLGQMVAANRGQSLAPALARGRVAAQVLVRCDRLAQGLRPEVNTIRHVGGWASWTADQWADRQLGELLDWSSVVPAVRRVATAGAAGRLHVVTALSVTPAPATGPRTP